jgi:hypothetical protein
VTTIWHKLGAPPSNFTKTGPNEITLYLADPAYFSTHYQDNKFNADGIKVGSICRYKVCLGPSRFQM